MFPKGRSLLRPAAGGLGAGAEARVAGGLCGPSRVEEAGVETEILQLRAQPFRRAPGVGIMRGIGADRRNAD